MLTAVVDPDGVVKFTAVVDGFILGVELHPHGADETAVARSLAALQGAMQALENHSWPRPKRTATPTRATTRDVR